LAKAGLLTYSCCSAFPAVRASGKESRNLFSGRRDKIQAFALSPPRELTAAGTVADLHGIPI